MTKQFWSWEIAAEMMRQECEDVLAHLSFGRLACSRDNQLYIVPIHFAGTLDCLYGFATTGQKIEWMRLNPLVCVEADEVRSMVVSTPSPRDPIGQSNPCEKGCEE